MSWFRRRFDARDSGAFTPMVVVMVMALFAMVALSVDGGGRMRTLEHADNIAAEAARAGGQAIDLGQAVAGIADVVDPAGAVAAANAYLANVGASGVVTISADRREITVVVSLIYQPVMLGLFDEGPWTETGSATAELLND
jgi:Flp pilus assembly protein TadG